MRILAEGPGRLAVKVGAANVEWRDRSARREEGTRLPFYPRNSEEECLWPRGKLNWYCDRKGGSSESGNE